MSRLLILPPPPPPLSPHPPHTHKGRGDILFLVQITFALALTSASHFLVCTMSFEPVVTKFSWIQFRHDKELMKILVTLTLFSRKVTAVEKAEISVSNATLTHLCRVVSSTLTLWCIPFPVKRGSVFLCFLEEAFGLTFCWCQCYSLFCRIMS